MNQCGDHSLTEARYWEGYHYRVEVYCLRCGEVVQVYYEEPQERERHLEDD